MKHITLYLFTQLLFLFGITQNQKATQQQLNQSNSAILPLSAGGTLPPHLDFSDKFPPSGNQCKTNSCASYACTYNLLTFLNTKKNNYSYKDYLKNGTLNKNIIFSPFFSFYFNKNSADCTNCTSTVFNTLNFLLENGSPFLSEFEVNPCDKDNCLIGPPTSLKTSAQEHKLQNFAWIFTNQNPSAGSPSALIKRFLYSKIPVVIIMDVSQDFLDLGIVDSDFVYEEDYTSTINDHTLICTGYDETKSALKFINSYSNWGDNGRIWISTKVIDKHLEEAYVADVNKDIIVKGVVRFVQPSIADTSILNNQNKIILSLFDNDFKVTNDYTISSKKINSTSISLKIIQKGADGLDYISKIIVDSKKTIKSMINGKLTEITLLSQNNKSNYFDDKVNIILKPINK